MEPFGCEGTGSQETGPYEAARDRIAPCNAREREMEMARVHRRCPVGNWLVLLFVAGVSRIKLNVRGRRKVVGWLVGWFQWLAGWRRR